MISDSAHAAAVQTRRRTSGKKGRSKAVRRWAMRDFNTGIDGYCYFMPSSLREALRGDFTGCRSFQKVHDFERGTS